MMYGYIVCLAGLLITLSNPCFGEGSNSWEVQADRLTYPRICNSLHTNAPPHQHMRMCEKFLKGPLRRKWKQLLSRSLLSVFGPPFVNINTALYNFLVMALICLIFLAFKCCILLYFSHATISNANEFKESATKAHCAGKFSFSQRQPWKFLWCPQEKLRIWSLLIDWWKVVKSGSLLLVYITRYYKKQRKLQFKNVLHTRSKMFI